MESRREYGIDRAVNQHGRSNTVGRGFVTERTMPLNNDEMLDIFRQTVVVRRPRYGIVTGYHELPYICIGSSIEPGSVTTQVKGKVRVSPRFVIRPSYYESSYEDIFGEENIDE